jgi:hypothetical protein
LKVTNFHKKNDYRQKRDFEVKQKMNSFYSAKTIMALDFEGHLKGFLETPPEVQLTVTSTDQISLFKTGKLRSVWADVSTTGA